MNIIKKRSQCVNKQGFTLIELMVVISIIIVFIAIILASVTTARQNTREKRRVSDLAQIELALTLYRQNNKIYPTAAAEIGFSTLDDEIKRYVGTIPQDPKVSTAANGTYGYHYIPNFACGTETLKVLYAKTMEQPKNGNYMSLCGGPIKNQNMYLVVLKE